MFRYFLTFFFLSALLLVACDLESSSSQITPPQQSAAPRTIVGTTWSLVSLRGNPLLYGTSITLNLMPGFLSGQMSCNQYGGGPDSGKYVMTDQSVLKITQLAVTLQLCSEPEGVMQQEQRYIETLQKAMTYRVIEDRLEIQDESGETTLVFVRQ